MHIAQFLLWLPMIVIAFGNATIRELVFMRHLNELQAQQLSTVTFMLLCALYTWFVFPFLQIQYSKQAFLVGFVWVLLTVVFEFSLGRLTGKSWEYLFRDYHLFAGRLWLIFLTWLFLLPYLCFAIRK